MSREVEVEALNRVSASHYSWSEARQLLHVALKAADDQNGPAPVAELQADYLAQKALVRDVVAFVELRSWWSRCGGPGWGRVRVGVVSGRIRRRC